MSRKILTICMISFSIILTLTAFAADTKSAEAR